MNMIASKTEQLNQLFEEWIKSMSNYKGKFVKDGINDDTLFEKAEHQILFLMKEPNNPEQKEGDFRDWWKENISGTFTKRIAEWSYGILNDFPEFDTINNINGLNALHQVAFMNLKKIGGGGNSIYNEIELHYRNSELFVQRQIEIIKPKIIILRISFNEKLRNSIFPNVEWKQSGYGIQIGKFKDIKIIDFYHPSSRSSSAATYSLLQNIIQSEKFKSL